jgi:hypothetical protein
MELKPDDRRRRDAARGRDRDDRPRAAEGITLEHAVDARCEHEDRDDCRERQLKAGVEQRVRVRSEERRRPDK